MPDFLAKLYSCAGVVEGFRNFWEFRGKRYILLLLLLLLLQQLPLPLPLLLPLPLPLLLLLLLLPPCALAGFLSPHRLARGALSVVNLLPCFPKVPNAKARLKACTLWESTSQLRLQDSQFNDMRAYLYIVTKLTTRPNPPHPNPEP